MKIGVLALQGASQRHAEVFGALGAHPVEVRTPEALAGVDAIVLPGGESTTIDKLLRSAGLAGPLTARLADGLPALGTCAGMILLAAAVIDGRPDQTSLGAIDIDVRRNAFGRQAESFEIDLTIAALAGEGPANGGQAGGGQADGDQAGGGPGVRPFPAIFIRAPVVERVGAGVEVLATVDGRPVLCRQGAVLVAAFHPELSADRRIHELFLAGI